MQEEQKKTGQEEIIQALKTSGEKNLQQIGLWLDSYDDIFSDFDPRPYSKRQISDDFIYELKKQLKETPKGNYEINFYLPKEKRDLKLEAIIKKRLRNYFENESKILNEKTKKIDRKYLVYMLFGLGVLFAYGIILEDGNRTLNIIANLILPLGWFSVWTSLDYFINQKNQENEKLLFFDKMKKCNYSFLNFENLNEISLESKQLKEQ